MKFTALPFEVGPVHFVGIGGIGMSGIAEVMLNLGYKVQGSDIKANPNVERLTGLGATVAIGHKAANVDGAGAIVVSSAIKPDNPELVAARAAKIPVVRRAEMLAELMRLKFAVAVGGTHGKTTTTSLVAVLMDAAGVDPTVINGGIISAYGSNAKVGLGDWMAVEADESDGSFLKLRSTVAIVTNIDPEHMEHYGTFDVLRQAFFQFVENLPFYGFAVLCTDHPEVQSLASRVEDRRVITYGQNPQADARLEKLKMDPSGATFDVRFRLRGQDETVWRDIFLPMMGEHNVLNAVAALATARELGLTEVGAKTALGQFGGVKRRFTRTGEWKGAAIIDDYGHHPVEIAAVLKAARQAATGKVIAVMQPHRYSRLHDLFDDFSTCFNDADSVLVTPVYTAGEDPIEGADQAHLVESLRSHGHRDAGATTRDAVASDVAKRAGEGDVVVCLGAGDITQWAYALPGELEALGQ
ncbi:UDP-N-acetylmuramate--L-alanine ligase [Maricaulis maris]|uniref:UDP-N-acetylmuramate--L-alanine ligase n=1 Tax=Maricaulis maris TaxID=74318 RepID=UPI003A8D9B82